jgi:hypothetical protein
VRTLIIQFMYLTRVRDRGVALYRGVLDQVGVEAETRLI